MFMFFVCVFCAGSLFYAARDVKRGYSAMIILPGYCGKKWRERMRKSKTGPTPIIVVALAIIAAPSVIKLAGVGLAHRPWWFVTLPMWAVFALLAIAGIALAIVTLLVARADHKAQR